MLHKLGDDRFGLQIIRSVVVVAFVAHSPVDALDDAVGFWMPRFDFNIDQVVRLDDRRENAMDELATVVVYHPGLGILTHFERCLELDRNRFALKDHQQLVVDDIAAIRIHKAEQE